MFARIIDSQGNSIAVVDWQVVNLGHGKVIDQFVDENSNVYCQRPHKEMIDYTEIVEFLTIGVNKFYQIQGVNITFPANLSLFE